MKKKIKKGLEKKSIVCIHGNSSSSVVFQSLFQSKLIQQPVIAFDLPGHKNNLENYKNHSDFSMSFFRTKLIEELKNIEDDIILVGNSLGGHLAIEIASQIKNLKGLVIFGTPPVKKPINFEEAFLPVEALQTYFTANPSEEAIDIAANIAVQNKEMVSVIASGFRASNPLVREKIAQDILSGNLDDEYEIYINLDIPKFIIAGDQDPSVNLDYLKSVNNSANNSELIIFENCGHYPSLEKPKEFEETMKYIISKI